MRMKDKLVIFLHIPLTSWNQNFNVYKVETRSLPIPGNYTHVTKISGLPNYLIVSDDRKHYYESNHKPMIHGDLIQMDFQPMSSNENSCVSAILENNPISFSKQCTTYLIKDGFTPQILQLTPDFGGTYSNSTIYSDRTKWHPSTI